MNDRMKYESIGEYYLPAKIYKIEKFLSVFNAGYKSQKHKLLKEMLPIFAVLMGNDYVDKQIFTSFMNSLNSGNNNSKKQAKSKKLLHPNKVF